MKSIKKQDAFTLVELMVVVAVLAILAAIAIPSYLGIQKRTARSEAKSNLQALSLALEGYMSENNDYGAANLYTYFEGAFGHSGNLEIITQLGNNILYEYQIRTFTSPSPSYTIQAVPRRGIVENDITLWLDSNGDKGPPGAGW
jgi:prepilin-type N-terminal cleavage/methylation domain-containing protein